MKKNIIDIGAFIVFVMILPIVLEHIDASQFASYYIGGAVALGYSYVASINNRKNRR